MRLLRSMISRLRSWSLVHIKGVTMPDGAVILVGMPWISRCYGSRIVIGSHTTIVSAFRGNVAGISHPTILATLCPGASIRIGRHAGLSGATVVAATQVEIGDYAGLGADVRVYDTDFHAEDPDHRRRQRSPCEAPSEPVRIGNDVWVGAHTTILKGVTIGDRSVIGAGSVVTRDVPPDCVAAGSPARVLRSIRRESPG